MRNVALTAASAVAIISAGCLISNRAEAMLGARESVGLAAQAIAPVALARIPPGFSHGRKFGWRGAHHPPGWSHGRKFGWRGGSMPRGLRR
jgi:hypothetical protein